MKNKYKFFKARMAFVVACIIMSFGAWSQTVNTYGFTSSTGAALDPMTGSVQLIGTGDDDNPSTVQSIGFNFVYEGVTYTQYSLTPDGFLKLGSVVAVAQFTNSTISATNIPRIFPMWDDAATGTTGQVHTVLTGVPGSQIRIIDWFITNPRSTGGAANTNYQVWLYEGTNVIQFRYGSSTSTGTPSSGASIGICGATATNFIDVTSSLGGGTSSTVTVNDANTVWPGNGTMYTFTPPPACAGTPTPGTITGAASVCSGTGTTLTLSGSTSGVTGITYQWESSTVSGGPYTNMGTALTQATGPLASTTFYVVTVTCTASGMSATTAEQSVVVNPNPTVGVLPTSAAICQPGAAPVPLTASGATTYSWLPAAGLSGTTGTTVNASPGGTTTYTVTGTSSGCTGTATTTITVSETPSVGSVTATPPSVCSGGNSQLLATAGLTSGYTASNPAFSTVPCQATAGPVGDDVMQGGDAIGFNFTFYGRTYTQFGICTNGNIQLGDGTGSVGNPAYSISFTDVAIPNAATPNNLIALAWDDWLTSAGQITYGTTGVAPNRKLVVCFNTTGRGGGSADTLNGQIVLEETTNKIYLNIIKKGVQPANTATQGIEDQTGSIASVAVAGRNNVAWSANNSSEVFTPSGGGGSLTYSWSPATFLSSTTINNPMANAVTATTTYTVTVSNGTCSSTGSATITAGSALTSTSNITPSNSVCVGTNITLNAVPAGGGAPYTFSWSGPNSFASTSQNPTITGVTALAAGTYTVTVTDNCLATSVSTVTLTVNSPPSVSVTPNTGLICNPGGTAVSLTASGASTYTWLPVTGLTPSTGSVVSANPTATTTYTVTGTDVNGCSSTNTAAITVSAAPTLTATATPNSVCSGGNSQLLATASMTTTYSASSTAFSTQPCQANPGPVGDDVIQGGDPIGFSFNFYGTNYTQFAICTNGNIQLGDGTGSVGNPAYNNTWIDAAIPNTGLPNNLVALAWDDWLTTAGTDITWGTTGVAPNRKLIVCYNTTGRGDGGTDTLNGQIVLEETTNNIYLNIIKKGVNPAGTATQGIEDQTGSAASVAVPGRNNVSWSTNNTSELIAPNPVAFTYAWTPPTFLTSTTIANPMANAITSTTTYTVTATAPSGCSATATATVTSGATLTSTSNITPSNTVCSGTNITLNSVPTGGGLPYTYAWSGPAGFTSTVQNPVITGATVAATGTYTITVTDNCGAISTTMVTLTVNPNPSVAVTPTSGLICNPGGSAVSLTASGLITGTYSWAPGTGLSGTTGTNVSATPAATTTYTVTGTDGNGCMGTAIAVINVGVTPVLTASTTTPSVCTGSNAILTAAGSVPAAGYCQPVTSCSFPDIITNVTFGTINRSSACDGGGSGGFTFYPAPNPTITAGAPTPLSVSTGGDVEGAAVWIDYNQNGVFEATELVQNGFAGTNPATYAVSVTVPTTAYNGPTRMRVRCVYFSDPSTIGPCANTTYGETEDYTITITGATDAVAYAWSPSTFLTSTTGAHDTAVAMTASTTYTVVTTSTAGCTASASVAITVNPLPTVTATASASPVCAGSAETLTGGGSAVTYIWSGGVTDATPFSATTTTTYTVTGTDGNGCMDTASVTVMVNPLPTVTATASANPICAGSSETLTGGGATTYTWSGGVTDATAFTITTTGTYTVTGTDVNGCMDTASTSITVNPLPTVTATSSAAVVCAGASDTLTGGGTALTYSWTGGVTDATGFVPASTLTYTVTGTDMNGCMDTASTAITVNPLPVVTATASAAAVCTGASEILTGGGATSYTWTGGVTDGVPFVPVSTLTYTVTGTDMNGCMNTASTTVTVNPLPVVNLGMDTVQCGGGVLLDAGNPGSTYAWSDLTSAQTTIASTTGNYSVTVTDVNSCSASDTIMVTINALPVVNLGPDVTQCGGSVTLDAGNPGSTYLWSNSSTAQTLPVFISGSFSVTVTNPATGCTGSDAINITINSVPVVNLGSDSTQCGGSITLTAAGTGTSYLWSDATTASTLLVTSSGTYSVTVGNGTGCTASDTVMIVIHPLPAVGFVAPTSPVCLQAAPIALTGVPAGGIFTGTGVVPGPMFDPSVSGVGTFAIMYSVTDVNSCSNSVSHNITVQDCSGIVENTFAQEINVYPNPTSGMFNIEIQNANFSSLMISIVDLQGKEVYNVLDKNITADYIRSINLENFAKGIYYIKFSTDTDVKIKKLIIQ